jgi:signal transduction histidine kinase
MRRRILVSTLAVVVLAVAMLAVPLLVVVERYVDPPDQLRAGGLVLGLAVLAVAAAMVVAARAARRTVAPLSQLATDAARLAGGDLGPTGRRYGAEELDHVAEALDSSAVRLGELVRRERQLAADVSHQLRSRLTALSMRLEEVAALSNTAVRAEAEAALDQVDRMVHIVDELLDQARTERAHNAVELDVAEHLAALRADWDDAFRVSGRTLRIDTPGGLDEEPRLRARATPGHVAQALGVLIENALQHGAGTVTVAARARGEHVVVEVRDEGVGVPDPLVPLVFDRGVSGGDGTGIGLAVARALVEADSGRLELRQARPAVFAVYLPRISNGD